jgi:hypothetical protein
MGGAVAKTITDEDIAFLNENFTRFGEGWKPGLAGLEKSFQVSLTKKRKTFQIDLISLAWTRVRYQITIQRKGGSMSHTGPDLPEGNPLESTDLERVDACLATIGEMWMLEPLNCRCLCLNLSAGLDGLRRDEQIATHCVDGADQLRPRKVDTRWVDGVAVLYLNDEQWVGEMICIGLDLDRAEIVDVDFVDLPPKAGSYLSAKDVAFFDRSLKEHGDFGVYGNLTPGLRWLIEHFEVNIKPGDGGYDVSANPRDNHGHFFDFWIEEKTGRIDGVAAGHFLPEPDLDDFDMAAPEPEPEEE